MKTYKKIILGIALILIIFIALLIGINIGNKNSIQKPLSELQKLTEAREENSFVKTKDHLAEINTSLQTGIEQGKSDIWESIRNSETLSSKTDSSGNPIYGNVNDINSLETAITTDNNNSKLLGQENVKNNPADFGLSELQPLSTAQLITNSNSYTSPSNSMYLVTYLIDNQGSTYYSISCSTTGKKLYSISGPTAMGSGRYACYFVGVFYLETNQEMSFSRSCNIYKLTDS